MDEENSLRPDERQAKLNQGKDRNRKPLAQPPKADLSKLHGLSLGGRDSKQVSHVARDGARTDIRNLNGEEVKNVLRMLLRSGGIVEVLPNLREPKPGEPEQVMPREAMADAVRTAGLTGLLVEDMISIATKGVITRDHVQYETYQTRFQNRLRATAKILWDADKLVVWGRTERVDGVNKKRFWSGPQAPPGVDIVEPGA